MNDGDDRKPSFRDGLHVVVKSRHRRLRISEIIKKKIEVRSIRLLRLRDEVEEQRQKATRWSDEVARLEKDGAAVGGNYESGLAWKTRLKMSALKKLADLEERIQITTREIEILESNDIEVACESQEVNGDLTKGDFGEANTILSPLVERAREWGAKHGIDGFVETIDQEGGLFEVIRLHKARNAKVAPTVGVWPALFSIEDSTKEETVARRLRMDALLATAGPDMQRMVGILSTPGMLHAVVIEALTLRGRVLPVSTDPEVLRRGRDALADFKVLDASVYEKVMKE